MKKIIIPIVVVLFIIVGTLVFFNSKEQVPDKLILKADDVTLIEVEKDEVVKLKDTTASLDNLNKSDEVKAKMEDWDKKFDRIEERFNKSMEKLFVKEFGLGEKSYKEYLKMREGMDQDKIRAFDSFHKDMERKYGPSYSYNPTEEEVQFERDIKKRYEKTLMRIIGRDHYVRYLEVKEKFNQDLMEQQDPEVGVILMDF